MCLCAWALDRGGDGCADGGFCTVNGSQFQVKPVNVLSVSLPDRDDRPTGKFGGRWGGMNGGNGGSLNFSINCDAARQTTRKHTLKLESGHFHFRRTAGGFCTLFAFYVI